MIEPETGRNRAVIRYLRRIGDLSDAGAYRFPGSTWAVLKEMATFADVRGGDIRPSTITLARRTGYDRSVVKRAIRALRLNSLLIETGRLNARSPVQYRLGDTILDPRGAYIPPNTSIREITRFASFAPEKMRGVCG